MALPEEEQATQEVQTTTGLKGKTVLSFTQPTPMWATWFFRLEFIINKCLMMYLSGTTHAIADLKNDVLILTIIDFGVWMFAKSIGVKKEDLGLTETGN